MLYLLLYLWAKEIYKQTGREVYIVKDNAALHTKAKRLSVNRRIKLGCINVVN
jgi:predicted RNA-binding protein YlxR (DUF448 family)